MTKGSLIDVEYRFSATANDGKILSQKNWLSGEDVTYKYDELERLVEAYTLAGPSWGLQWSYDGFGNRLSQTVSQGSAPASVTLVNGNTNRISSAGYSYDPNGNMTVMPKGSGSMTLDYDLSNRVSGLSHPDGSEQYRYAPDNRRVWRSAGRTACYASRGNDQELYWASPNGYGGAEAATEQIIFYSPGGQKMGAYCVNFSPNMQHFAVTASEENVYYGGRLVGKRIAVASVANTGVVSAFTADRLQSKGNGSNYYPYGESKTSTAGDDREGFATYTRDEKSGLDYADQRWYASGVGRFGSPDPYQASAGPSDPASWNRFTYVRGEPIGRYDPTGLADCVANQPCSITVTATPLPYPIMPFPGSQGHPNAPSLELPPIEDFPSGLTAGWPDELGAENCSLNDPLFGECDESPSSLLGAVAARTLTGQILVALALTSNRIGSAGESAVRRLTGLASSDRLRFIVGARNRVSDLYDAARNTLIEVKNMQYVNYSIQMKDYFSNLKDNPGRTLEIWLREGATVSKQLQEAIDRSNGRAVIKRFALE